MNSDSALASVLPDLRRRREEAMRHVDDARARLEEAEAEVQNVDMAFKGIRALVGGGGQPVDPVVEEPSVSAPSRNGRRLRGADAVEVVLRESAPASLTLGELTRELRDRGWLPPTEVPENAVRASANRLRKRNSDFVFAEGRFAYRPHSAHSPWVAAVG